VGFFRYWTLSNIPLFVLAFPMLTIMTVSSFWAMQTKNSPNMSSRSLDPTLGLLGRTEKHLLRSLAAPQLLLAILAMTSYHVQIITRISSGYCVWYFWLAYAIMVSTDRSLKLKTDHLKSSTPGGWSYHIVIYIVVYAAVQAGFFSSFLPPA
jgi:GPI mannosyltransferase 2